MLGSAAALLAVGAVVGRGLYQSWKGLYELDKERASFVASQRPGESKQRDPLSLMRNQEFEANTAAFELKRYMVKQSAARQVTSGLALTTAAGLHASMVSKGVGIVSEKLTPMFGKPWAGRIGSAAGAVATAGYGAVAYFAFNAAYNTIYRNDYLKKTGELIAKEEKAALGVRLGIQGGYEQAVNLKEIAWNRHSGWNTTLWNSLEVMMSGGYTPERWIEETKQEFKNAVGGAYARAWKAMSDYDYVNAKMAFNKARSWFKDDKAVPKSWREPEKTMLMIENSRITNRNYARSLNGRAKTRTGD